MNLEDFTRDLEDRLAGISDEELRAQLEAVGCVFEDPWAQIVDFESQILNLDESDSNMYNAAESNDLALAA